MLASTQPEGFMSVAYACCLNARRERRPCVACIFLPAACISGGSFLGMKQKYHYSSVGTGQNSGVDATDDAIPKETTGGARAAYVARFALATASPSGRSKPPLHSSKSLPHAVFETT